MTESAAPLITVDWLISDGFTRKVRPPEGQIKETNGAKG